MTIINDFTTGSAITSKKKGETGMNHIMRKSSSYPAESHYFRQLGFVMLLVSTIIILFSNTTFAQDIFRGDEGSKPYTHLRFQNDAENFQFAVISDQTGGKRPGVVPAAVDLLNLLQPEFVMSVGDFIEGYIEDEGQQKSQWEKVDESFKPLQMPLFFVMGNHDVNFDPSEQVWFDRVEANRGYSYFVLQGRAIPDAEHR